MIVELSTAEDTGDAEVQSRSEKDISPVSSVPSVVESWKIASYNNPFVLGSIRARRRSFAHAARSARANALNTASI